MSRGRVGSSLLSFALLIHANWTWHSSSRLPVVFSWSTTNNYNQQFNIRQPRSLSKQYLVVGAAETTTTTTTTTTRIHRDDEHPPVDPIVGLYVHIPFCRRRCRYCNFAIVPIGTRVATESDMDDNDDGNDDNGFRRMNQNYTDAILKELHVLAQQQGPKDSSSKIHLASIYFGGGTPSLAPVKTLQTILFAILDDDNSPFTVDRDNCEITMEMDPGTFSETKLRKIKDIGFNRISLGVQSFDDKILEAIGRVHRKTDIQKSIILLQNVFGDRLNYSVDLISGLPSMSPADWVETLQMVVSLDPQPQHLSLYDLQIEEGTVFGNWYGTGADGDTSTEYKRSSSHHSTKGEKTINLGHPSLPSEQEAAFMYCYAAGYLREKGYEHYEVSSYALKKTGDKILPYRSRHNQIYWDVHGQWYAFGLGATSFVDGILTARPKTLFDYIRWVEALLAPCKTSSDTSVPVLDALMDVVLKRLRTSDGLALEWIREEFGDIYVDAIIRGGQLGIDLGFANLDHDTHTIRLLDSRGFLYSNSIISSIFVELENAHTSLLVTETETII